jgi:hypothetical protein
MIQYITEEPILQMGTDRMIPRHVCNKPCTVRFLDRCEWKDGLQPKRKGTLMWYTNGHKTNKDTGAAVYGHGTRQKLSFNLGKYTTVFHAQWRI